MWPDGLFAYFGGVARPGFEIFHSVKAEPLWLTETAISNLRGLLHLVHLVETLGLGFPQPVDALSMS